MLGAEEFLATLKHNLELLDNQQVAQLRFEYDGYNVTVTRLPQDRGTVNPYKKAQGNDTAA